MITTQRTPLQCISHTLAQAGTFRTDQRRPFILLSYAQSVNGSIATRSNQQVMLSGAESLTLVHQLRAACDAILVGIGTVLADNPRLTARLVEGTNPQPIVLDTRLRMPPDARLLQRLDKPVWIVSGPSPSPEKRYALEQAGGIVLPWTVSEGGQINLETLMKKFAEQGVNSLMVEGGARVLTSFLNARLVDQLVITLAPKLLSGLHAIGHLQLKDRQYVSLGQVEYQQLGQDLILWAQPLWNAV